jgi:hypothetical protein
MTEAPYEIIEHDGGWAYTIGGVISQRYPTREAALINAEQAAGDQQARQRAHQDSEPAGGPRHSEEPSST